MIQSKYIGIKVNKSFNPDETVAYGATVFAAMKLGVFKEEFVILNVCPFSLGIGTCDDPENKLSKMNNTVYL